MEQSPAKKPSRFKRLFSRSKSDNSAKAPKASQESSKGKTSAVGSAVKRGETASTSGFALEREGARQAAVVSGEGTAAATRSVQVGNAREAVGAETGGDVGTTAAETFDEIKEVTMEETAEALDLGFWDDALKTLPENKRELLSEYYTKSDSNQGLGGRIDEIVKACAERRNMCLEKRWRFEGHGENGGIEGGGE